MASDAGAIRAGKAFVELYAKDSLSRGLKIAETKLKAFGASVASIGKTIFAAGLAMQAPLALAAHIFADTGSQLLLMSQRTGLSVESLAQLRFAAAESGVEVDSLETGLKKMAVTIQRARDGSHEARQALADIGISVADLQGMRPDELFERIAGGVAEVADPTARTARAVAIFGRNATELLPLLMRGAEGIRELREEANSPWTQQMAESARTLHLAWEAVARSVKGIAVVIGATLAPAMTRTSRLIKSILDTSRVWIADNKELVQIFDYLGIGLVGLGGGLFVVGKAFRVLGFFVGQLTQYRLLWSIIKGIGLAAFYLTTGFIALLTPINFIIGGVALLATGIVALAGTSSGAFGQIAQGFLDIGGIASTTWQGIRDAIAVGDWGGAMEIAWLGLQVAWEAGIGRLRIAWREFSGYFIDAFQSAVTALSVMIDSIVNRFDSVRAAIQNQVNEAAGLNETTQRAADLEAAYVRALRERVRLNNEENAARRERGEEEVALPADIQARIAALPRGAAANFQSQNPFNGTGVGAIMDAAQREQAERERVRAAQNAADEATIAAARERLANAQQALADEREWMEMMSDLFGGENGPATALDQAREKTDVKGTFSAYAVGGLGANNVSTLLQEGNANTRATAEGVRAMTVPAFT